MQNGSPLHQNEFKRVLAIDDSPISRQIYKSILSKSFQLEIAEDAEEALTKLKESPFDLILSDLFLPGKNGIELFQCLQNEGKHASTPFVIISADGEAIAHAKQEGIKYWLIKPIQPKLLISIIERILDN